MESSIFTPFFRLSVNFGVIVAADQSDAVHHSCRSPTQPRNNVVFGEFVYCWLGPHFSDFFHTCCGETGDSEAPGCFNSFYTKERCCAKGPYGYPRGRSVGLLHCLYRWQDAIHQCMDSYCDDDASRLHCNFVAEDEYCAKHCGGELPPSESAVSRSNSLGRLLACIAQQPGIRSVLDLWIGRGQGTTTLLARGLQRGLGLDVLGRSDRNIGDTVVSANSVAGSNHSALVIGFERSSEFFWEAYSWLTNNQSLNVFARRTQHLVNESQFQSFSLSIRRVIQSASVRGGVSALLYHGEPCPKGACASVWAERYGIRFASGSIGSLVGVCNAARVDALVIDGGFDISKEWGVVETHCAPLRVVVITATSYPVGAAWLKEYLLTDPNWVELLTGTVVDNSEKVSGAADPTLFFKARRWTVLAKVTYAHLVCAASKWHGPEDDP